MEITWQAILIICPLVFVAGFVDSIAGGGGLISLPAYFLAGVPAHMAIATNKLSSSLGTGVAAMRFWRQKYVQPDCALVGIACALCGSGIGSNLSLLASEDFIRVILIPLLPFVAWQVLRKPACQEQSDILLSRRRTYLIVAGSAFVVGMYDGFYGPGTGTFLIILFTGFAHMKVNIANGNSKMINLASNVMSLTVFLWNGQVLFALGIPAALCSIAGNYLGSTLAMKKSAQIVRPLIIGVLFLLLIKILWEMV